MPELLSRVEFARRFGVTPAAVTRGLQPGGPLAEAAVGRRIDAAHPIVVEWSKKRRPGRVPKSRSAGKSAEATDHAQPQPPKIHVPQVGTTPDPVNAEELEELHAMLSPLVARFGTATAFKDYLSALKTIVDIREKDLKNDEARSKVISRELVATHVFGHLEAAQKRLLTESVKTIARRVFADAKAGRTIADAERTVHDIISTQLKGLKGRAVKALRGGSG